jgi:hypothetical protein
MNDHIRSTRARRVPAFAVAIFCCLLATAVCRAQTAPPLQAAPPVQTAPDQNRFSDELQRLPPPERAAKLADHLGVWCIGTKPFFMGETKAGPAKGYAYWSVTCAGGAAYMIQITPNGQGAAIDCRTLKQGGEGRECYKTF